MNATWWGRAPGDRPERVGQVRVAAALDDEPRPALEQRRRRIGEQVEALLRIEPPDHPDDGPGVGRVEPDPRQQVGPAGGLARPILARVRRGEVGIGGRVPDLRVEAVEDPEEPVALGAQRAVEAHPELGRQRLGRETRARRCWRARPARSRSGAGRSRRRRARRRRRPVPARAGRAPDRGVQP